MNSGGGPQTAAFVDSSEVNTPTRPTSGHQQATQQQLDKTYTQSQHTTDSSAHHSSERLLNLTSAHQQYT